MVKDVARKGPKLRHDPLGKQIKDSENAHLRQRNRVGRLSKDKEETEEISLNQTESKKILQQIRAQAIEAEEEDRKLERDSKLLTFEQERKQEKLLNFDDFVEDDDQNEDGQHIADDFNDDFEQLSDTESTFGAGEVEIDQEDERVLEMFMNGGNGQSPFQTRFTLGDIIENKLKEHEFRSTTDASQKISPKVIDVYTKVGKLLESYTSGKVPRAFRILPNFKNWEDLLYLTRPDKWTPHAIRVATKLFCMGTNSKITQRFLSIVVLPKVRDDIAEHKKLNVHLYFALKKSLYRPSAFYKAILLPLAENGDCTLLEAKIIGSVITKISIPVLHSSVALMKLSQLKNYNGATSMFIRILADKKYALPYRVIDALVDHFVSFTDDTRELPVLWHRALLSFVQRYKTDITKEQKELIKPLLRNHTHHIITNEIRRELFSSKSRFGLLPDTTMSEI